MGCLRSGGQRGGGSYGRLGQGLGERDGGDGRRRKLWPVLVRRWARGTMAMVGEGETLAGAHAVEAGGGRRREKIK